MFQRVQNEMGVTLLCAFVTPSQAGPFGGVLQVPDRKNALQKCVPFRTRSTICCCSAIYPQGVMVVEHLPKR